MKITFKPYSTFTLYFPSGWDKDQQNMFCFRRFYSPEYETYIIHKYEHYYTFYVEYADPTFELADLALGL